MTEARDLPVRTAEVAEGADAMALLHQLAIPLEEVGVLSINGRQATLDQPLQAGDLVVVVPPMGGG